MTEADLREFIALVSEMRTAQRQYFSTRDQSVLQRSKELERQVDRFIDNVNQPDIFGGNT